MGSAMRKFDGDKKYERISCDLKVTQNLETNIREASHVTDDHGIENGTKLEITVLILSLLIASVSSAGDVSGYVLLVNHVPKWGWKKGGLGVGRSVRYDIRKYPEVAVKREVPIFELLKDSKLPALDFLKSPSVPLFPFDITSGKE
ncbi:uncharacterized protein CDAR_439831 [Caerostris darwini]|uniref:Uncharacterized protein n=1 Tax=Caerostris darwini TaxID=1538125 RepID=A0AAV4TMC4_9ARAC|nr:uncharacterized protein CDAR_439831 [Caerostris darwini]